MTHDIHIANHGSICLLFGGSEAGTAWIDANLRAGNDEILTWGDGVVVEPRYVQDIVGGAINDGLEIG